MSYSHIPSASRRHLVQYLVLVVAAVAATNREREAWNDLVYYDFLRRAIRGEIVIRGAGGLPVQTKRGTWTTGSSFGITLNSAPANGNSLVMAVGVSAGALATTVSSITQTGASWSRIIQKQANSNLNDVEIWAAFGVSGAAAAITVNMSGTINTAKGAVGDVWEYSGLLTTGQPDQTQTNSGSGVPSTGTTLTTSQANEVWVGGIMVVSVSQSTPTNGFNLTDGALYTNGTVSLSLAYLDKIVTATGTASTGTTIVGAHNWVGGIATFLATTTTTTYINQSDTGSGHETPSPLITSTFGVSDSGHGADNPVERMNFLDNGIGDDTPFKLFIPISDSGHGSDVEGLTVTANDSGSGTEVESLTLTVGDSGSGAEVEATDDGSLTIPIGTVDQGSGLESISVVVTFSVDETGSGVDSVTQAISAYDNGIGTEDLFRIEVSMQDQGTGVEDFASNYSFIVQDSGLGVDDPVEWMYFNDRSNRINVPSGGIDKQFSDTGTGVETYSIQTNLALTDTGLGTGAVSFVHKEFMLSDSGIGQDGIDRFTTQLLRKGRHQYSVKLLVTETAFDPTAFDPYAYS